MLYTAVDVSGEISSLGSAGKGRWQGLTVAADAERGGGAGRRGGVGEVNRRRCLPVAGPGRHQRGQRACHIGESMLHAKNVMLSGTARTGPPEYQPGLGEVPMYPFPPLVRRINLQQDSDPFRQVPCSMSQNL